MTPDAALDYVRRLHTLVDELTAPIAAAHAGRLRCGAGCTDCCIDGVTVFAIEAERIRAEFPDVLAEPPSAAGCALLGPDGRCRVYAARPYVCRTQGLPLRWGENGKEHRDICPLNEPGPPLGTLPLEAVWTLGPVEARLRTVQESVDGGEGRRVALRSLCSSS